MLHMSKLVGSKLYTGPANYGATFTKYIAVLLTKGLASED